MEILEKILEEVTQIGWCVEDVYDDEQQICLKNAK